MNKSSVSRILREESAIQYRERCYECYRPVDRCFCSAIPAINNRTNVLILQHVKERFHAFNTARIVRKALQNSTLIVDQTLKLASRPLPFEGSTGVLFPGQASRLLSETPPTELPQQLVILDGTWHHAKTLMNRIPALASLPQFRLEPESPSRYRLRREPTETSLSTLEATIAALRLMEPETSGFDDLLAAFDQMVETQLQHPGDAIRLRRSRRMWTGPSNIPSVLIDVPDDVVVVYGEASQGGKFTKDQPREPIYWVAERLTTGETFAVAMRTVSPPSGSFLEMLQLTPEDFSEAVTIEEFSRRWRAFLRPGDQLVAYHESSLRLLRSIVSGDVAGVSLKSVNLKSTATTLDGILNEVGADVPVPTLRGRAGERLANAVAYAKYLRDLALRSSSKRPQRSL